MNLTDSDMETFERIKHYIQAHVQDRISVAELCSLAGMGENKFTRGFKFLNQISVSQFQLFISMEYGKALLEEGMQVKEVAILLGYTSPGHFTRAFSRVFNHPPNGIRPK